MKPNEPWIEHLQNSLENYSEELPQGGWERLEKALEDKERKKRIFWLFPKKGWAAAAAILLLAMIPASFIHEYHSVKGTFSEVRKTDTANAVYSNKDVVAVVSTSLSANEIKRPKRERYMTAISTKTADSIKEKLGVDTTNTAPQIPEDERQIAYTEPQKSNETASNESVTDKKAEEPKPYTIDDLLRNEIQQSNLGSAKKEWQLGLMAAVGNGEKTEGDQMPSLSVNREYFSYGFNSLASVEPDRMEHHLPLSFGLTVSTSLSKHFGAETGVVYTYLLSDVYENGSSNSQKQQLHYLGIPLRISYIVYSSPRIDIYAAMGFMAEKCVSGRIVSDNVTVGMRENKLQWSANGSAGVQYNLSKHVGIYLEPQINYYFDNHSFVKNVYKDKPLGIHGRVGLRVNL